MVVGRGVVQVLKALSEIVAGPSHSSPPAMPSFTWSMTAPTVMIVVVNFLLMRVMMIVVTEKRVELSSVLQLTLFLSTYLATIGVSSITRLVTVVPRFSVLGFSALPGFRALKAGDGAWSVHKTLFGFRAPLSQLFI